MGKKSSTGAAEEERRQHPRVPFVQMIRYRYENKEELKQQLAADISLGGMFLQTDEPEPLGTLLHFEFEAEGAHVFSGFGKVVRVNLPDGGEQMDPGMGIEFLKLTDESKVLLRTLLADNP